MIHFDSKQSQSIFNQTYYENAMTNNCKKCFNAHYQPHCHPTTKSLWLLAVYIVGRRTNLFVYGWRPKPLTKKLQYIAYDTTAVLLWHLKTRILIWWPRLEIQQNEFLIEQFELD